MEPRGKIPVPGWAEMHENRVKYAMEIKEKKRDVIILCTQQNLFMRIIFMWAVQLFLWPQTGICSRQLNRHVIKHNRYLRGKQRIRLFHA